ncbi:cytochrome P450 [Kitasatospora nipponensis]|uniref:Cytochrome P450 n=1 Tax=Kitasatospora nipponensis TaxID=258049 RepID=A0ABN1VXR2_9ACTN
MTTADHTTADPALTPPPGCPAHGLGPGGLRRLYGPEAESDPMGLYATLRADYGPVAPVLLHGDLPVWLVLGHREALEVARTPSRFSRDSRRWSAFRDNLVPADSPLLPMVTWQPVTVCVDGAEHLRLRKAVTDSLEQLDRRGVRRHVTRFADQLIDEFAGSGSADVIAQFAERLPMLVMTQLLGMPEENGPQLVNATLDLMKATETAITSEHYVVSTLRQLVERKAQTPGADITSWLLRHEAQLSHDEVIAHLRLILSASNVTTINLIADTLWTVLTDPRFRANLSGGQRTLLEALDQVLWDSPPALVVTGWWATGDTELAGQPIREGDMLLLGVAAGNVDPAIRPDLSEPLYGNRAHLAFSAGPHECPGQDIGRAIAETGIDVLLTRLPDLRLGVPESELRWTSSWMARHLVALPTRFTATRPRSAAAPVPGQRSAPVAAPVTPLSPYAQPVSPYAQPVPVDRAPRRGWWARLTGRGVS